MRLACGGKPAPVGPADSVVVAWIVVVPAVDEVMLTAQEPVPPDVLQVFRPPTKAAVAPPLFCSENVIVVPFGALT